MHLLLSIILGSIILGALCAYLALYNHFENCQLSAAATARVASERLTEAQRIEGEAKEWQAKEIDRLKLLEEAHNAEYGRKLAAVHAAQAMLARGEPPDTSHAGVSTYLRNAFRQNVLVGEHLRVMYLLSTDGFLTLRWEVDWPAGSDPMVHVSRGGSVIRTDWGRDGQHNDKVAPGRHHYKFLVGGWPVANRPKDEEMIVEIVVPEPEVWEGKAPGTGVRKKQQKPGQRERALLQEKAGAFIAIEQATARLRKAVQRTLERQAIVEEDFESRMARFDGRIAEIRDEIGA